MVEIHTRDCNGRHTWWQINWDAGDDAIYQIAETSADEEILLITYNGVCVYSGLCDEPIIWEEVVGFFA